MKRTFTKLFMLSAALLLSTATFAQDEIQHRYPAIPYTYENHTYEMPAWDIFLSDMGYIRIQTIAPLPATDNDHFKGKIVARRVFNNDSTYNYGDYMYSSNPTEANIIIGGKKLADLASEGEAAPKNWTYGLACDALGKEIADEARNVNVFNIQGRTSGTDFTIPKEYQVKATSSSPTYRNRWFDIVEIGVGAFRNVSNSSISSNSQNIFAITGTLTIPNSITKIEHNAFRHGAFKKVVFEEGSMLTTIEKATFEGNKYLEEVNIPASVTKIEGTAFGSCQNLNKVVFEGNLPTLTKVEEEPTYTKSGRKMPEGGYNIFQGALRFQPGYGSTAGTTGSDLTPSKCIIEVPMGQAKGFIDSNDGLFQDFVFSSRFPLTTSSGMMTYCSDLDFTFKQYNTADKSWSAGGMKAYYVEETKVFDAQESENGKLILTEIGNKKIPGWTATDDFGVVLRGTGADNEDGTYNIFYPNTPNANMTEKLSMAETGNCLHGVITQTPIEVTAEENENYSFFILSGGKFYRVMTDGNCKPYRAYLKVGDGGQPHIGTGGARELAIEFPETTGIVSHEAKSAKNDTFYNLQGIQVKQPQKGIFIKNGKKYVIK